jgi:hypothetical protein
MHIIIEPALVGTAILRWYASSLGLPMLKHLELRPVILHQRPATNTAGVRDPPEPFEDKLSLPQTTKLKVCLMIAGKIEDPARKTQFLQRGIDGIP